MSVRLTEQQKACVYLDHAATTDLREAAKAALSEALSQQAGNAGASHSRGRAARSLLNYARESVAQILGCPSRGLTWTSGGTEACNQMIATAAAWGKQQGKTHVVVSAIEHQAIRKAVEREFQNISVIDANEEGYIDPRAVGAAVTKHTAAVCVMAVNNEIGTIQPLPQIAARARKHGALVCVDAVQAVGHIPITMESVCADMMVFSAHKFGGLIGSGAFCAREGLEPYKLIVGGEQELGFRAGTEAVALSYASAAALLDACQHQEEEAAHTLEVRTRFEQLVAQFDNVVPTAWTSERCPGISHLCVRGHEGQMLVAMLDQLGICCSAGAACASGAVKPSATLLSMGIDPQLARGSLRFSFAASSSTEDAEAAAFALEQILNRNKN